jgi:uncharacterized protein (DUF2249 family)
MDKLIYLPSMYFPQLHTKAYITLRVLADGEPHTKRDFLDALDDDPRSTLQSLKGATYGHWLIQNLAANGPGIYRLDYRHLSGNKDQDMKARIESEHEYKWLSLKRSEEGAQRLPRARENEAAARAALEHQRRLDFGPE